MPRRRRSRIVRSGTRESCETSLLLTGKRLCDHLEERADADSHLFLADECGSGGVECLFAA
jgi:hypothetical protein